MNRNIYDYSDGTKTVYADPLVIRDELFRQSRGGYAELLKKIRAMGPNAAPEVNMEGIDAREMIDGLSRSVFKLPDFNPATGTGFTREQSLAVLFKFLNWCTEQKKNSNGQPSSFPVTAETSPEPSQITPITSG